MSGVDNRLFISMCDSLLFYLYDLRVMVAVVCNLTSSIFGQALLKVVQNLYCNVSTFLA